MRQYVDRFMWEAQKRGVFPDTTRLSFEFDRNIELGDPDLPVIGLCTRTDNLNQVTLDTLNALWLLSGYLGKEEIVFHELGHCLLGRHHRDDKFESGDFASIMRSVGLLQYGDLDNYNGLFTNPTGLRAHRREYYIEELFNENTSAPCWSDSNRVPPYPVTYFANDFIVNRDYRRLWIDANDNLWLYGGEKNYSYQHGAFIQELPGVQIASMNSSQSGETWVAGEIDEQKIIGIYKSGTLEIIYNQSQLPNEMGPIDQFLIDDSDRVWISDLYGNLYVNSSDGFDLVALPSQVRLSAMEKGPDNKVYVLKEGLFYVVENAATPVQFGKQNSDLPTSLFRNMKIDRDGVVWLQPGGSSDYLLQFNPDQSVKRINLIDAEIIGIRINQLASGADGTIWIATTNGIRKWENQSFSAYCKYNTGFRLLNFRQVLVASNGDIWSSARDPATQENLLVLSEAGI
ncbi:MAG: hypothetical protein DHS20C17_08840 [Cyclobacteriaceae bacterium]|nr:MAG: hypothetical protein DHS20C17_08840 [Cyclobacteriaceae bacterium]